MQKESSEVYKNSFLNIGVSPEYNIGEVSLAALYRQVGWQISENGKSSRFSEGKVGPSGTLFFNKLASTDEMEKDDLLSIKDWKQVVNVSLTTPKMPQQAKSKIPVLYPYVPDCTLYSNSARLRGNPWNPGNLIEQIILTGTQNKKEADEVWESLFHALSSNPENEEEDFLARVITLQFKSRRPEGVEWKLNPLTKKDIPKIDEHIRKHSPAFQFVNDLKKIIQLKSALTRRQWLSIMESNLRIGCAAHILWVCNINAVVFNFFRSCLLLDEVAKSELASNLSYDSRNLWKLEEKAVSVIKEQIQKYIRGYIGINFLLEKLVAEDENVSLDSIEDIYSAGQKIKNCIKQKRWNENITLKLNSKLEEDPKLMNCKGGITKNIFEFIRYSLGQKQTADPHKKNHDQAYWLRKKGDYSSAPWIVDLGPASILTMVYCCSIGYDQNRTIMDLLKHLRGYGFNINQTDLENSNMLNTLATLQVISDSPDAEGGMVIINPFSKTLL